MKEDALFCVGPKAFIEKDGKLLVLFASDEAGKGLDFPGGKIQEGEAKVGDRSSLTNALKREVEEETGFDIEVGDTFYSWYYEFPEGSRNYPKVVYLVGFKCKYISGDLKLSDEHVGFKWVDANNYKELDDGSDYFKAIGKYFS